MSYAYVIQQIEQIWVDLADLEQAAKTGKGYETAYGTLAEHADTIRINTAAAWRRYSDAREALEAQSRPSVEERERVAAVLRDVAPETALWGKAAGISDYDVAVATSVTAADLANRDRTHPAEEQLYHALRNDVTGPIQSGVSIVDVVDARLDLDRLSMAVERADGQVYAHQPAADIKSETFLADVEQQARQRTTESIDKEFGAGTFAAADHYREVLASPPEQRAEAFAKIAVADRTTGREADFDRLPPRDRAIVEKLQIEMTRERPELAPTPPAQNRAMGVEDINTAGTSPNPGRDRGDFAIEEAAEATAEDREVRRGPIVTGIAAAGIAVAETVKAGEDTVQVATPRADGELSADEHKAAAMSAFEDALKHAEAAGIDGQSPAKDQAPDRRNGVNPGPLRVTEPSPLDIHIDHIHTSRNAVDVKAMTNDWLRRNVPRTDVRDPAFYTAEGREAAAEKIREWCAANEGHDSPHVKRIVGLQSGLADALDTRAAQYRENPSLAEADYTRAEATWRITDQRQMYQTDPVAKQLYDREAAVADQSLAQSAERTGEVSTARVSHRLDLAEIRGETAQVKMLRDALSVAAKEGRSIRPAEIGITATTPVAETAVGKSAKQPQRSASREADNDQGYGYGD